MKEFIDKIKNYIKKINKARKINNVKRIKNDSEFLFNVVKFEGKPVLTFNRVVITTPDECDLETLVNKMFTLRDMYTKKYSELKENL